MATEKELRQRRKKMVDGGYKTFLNSPAGKDFVEFLVKGREKTHHLAEERIVESPDPNIEYMPIDTTTMAMLLGSAKSYRDILSYVRRRAGVDKNT